LCSPDDRLYIEKGLFLKASEKTLAVVVVIMLIIWAGLSLSKKRTEPERALGPATVTEETKAIAAKTLSQKPEEIVSEIIPDEEGLSKTWDLVCDPFVKLKTKRVDIEEISNLKLEGIIWAEKPPRFAVINDVNVTEGDIICGFKVEEIQKDKVILDREGNRYIIELWANRTDVKDNGR
jgi:hypothetical protein